MSKEFQRSLELKATRLASEYDQFLQKTFSGVHTVEEFMERFNVMPWSYQDIVARKLDPVLLDEFKICCSTAALLLSLWWLKQAPQCMPSYLIEDIQGKPLGKSGAHVSVWFPSSEDVQINDVAVPHQDIDQTVVRAFHWTDYENFSKLQRPYRGYFVHGFQDFLQNRISVLGLPKRYSTKRNNSESYV